jgi:hypothetical protein
MPAGNVNLGSVDKTPRPPEKVFEVCEYMLLHSNNTTLKEVARVVGVSTAFASYIIKLMNSEGIQVRTCGQRGRYKANVLDWIQSNDERIKSTVPYVPLQQN